jgi:hypothetical protein
MFSIALNNNLDISKRERVSFDLYNAAHFEKSERARFLTLVIAVEALLEPESRSLVAREHVTELIQITKNSQSLSNTERNSLIGSLNWLRNESIRGTARKLVEKRLGKREYMDLPAPMFFLKCYDLRSKIVHNGYWKGQPQSIGKYVAILETFVADLLSYQLLETSI